MKFLRIFRYTTFAYSGLQVSNANGMWRVNFNLKNNGGVAGAEVAQMYLGYPKSAGEPPKVLRGFNKVGKSLGKVNK